MPLKNRSDISSGFCMIFFRNPSKNFYRKSSLQKTITKIYPKFFPEFLEHICQRFNKTFLQTSFINSSKDSVRNPQGILPRIPSEITRCLNKIFQEFIGNFSNNFFRKSTRDLLLCLGRIGKSPMYFSRNSSRNLQNLVRFP